MYIEWAFAQLEPGDTQTERRASAIGWERRAPSHVVASGPTGAWGRL